MFSYCGIECDVLKAALNEDVDEVVRLLDSMPYNKKMELSDATAAVFAAIVNPHAIKQLLADRDAQRANMRR